MIIWQIICIFNIRRGDLNLIVSLFSVRQKDEWEKRRKMRVKRERGWTGNSWGGTSLGPPDPGPNGGNLYPEILKQTQ